MSFVSILKKIRRLFRTNTLYHFISTLKSINETQNKLIDHSVNNCDVLSDFMHVLEDKMDFLFRSKFAVDRAIGPGLVRITHVSVRQIGVSPPLLIDALTRAISRRITSLWEETLTQVRNVFGFWHRPKSLIHYHKAFVQVLPRIDFRFLADSSTHALVTDTIASIMAVVADA